MSYNKLKSLVANVEAIKTALQIHIQGRQATPEEKETLSQYSGFGGIKEVLNIGTDKPVSGDMEEPIRRLQELIDTYPYFTEAMKASVLTAFYTPKFLIDVVAKQIHATFKDNELQMRSFLEPSAGIGGFLPVASSERLRLQPQTVCSRYPRNAPHTAAKPLQVGKRVYRGHGGRDTQLRRPQPCIARGSEVHHGIPQGSRETHPIKITDV